MTWNNHRSDGLLPLPPNTRRDDYDTSIDGAASVKMRARSQRFKLLDVFASWHDAGCTDEEAASGAGLLRSCYWKRCGELRALGLIEFTGQRAKGDAGVNRLVSAITPKGREVVRLVHADLAAKVAGR
jgi:hypothetical protein